MMSGVPLATCWAFNKLWNNKFYYKAASRWLFLLIQSELLTEITSCILRNRATWKTLCVMLQNVVHRLRLKCDRTRAGIRFCLSAKRTSPFKSAGAPLQSTTGSRGVCISGNNAGYTMFRGSVKSTGYPLHSPVSPSLPLPRVTVCHHISTGLCFLFSLPVWTSRPVTRLWTPSVRVCTCTYVCMRI